MAEKFNMPWEDRPAGCTECDVALLKKPRNRTLSDSLIKQYLQ